LSDIKPFWIPDRVGNDKKNSFRTVWDYLMVKVI